MSPIHTSSESIDRLPPLGYKEVTFLRMQWRTARRDVSLQAM